MNSPKYYRFQIDFNSEEDRDNFKNYLHHVKTATGKPIYQIAMEMIALHKEKYKKR